jgi:hypothetical protein
MLRIIEKTVDLEFPVGAGINTLIAQISNRLKLTGRFFKIADASHQTDKILSIIDIAANQPGEERLHFIIFPESSLPFEAFNQVMNSIDASLPENSVVVFGIEHIALDQYRELLERFNTDNVETLDMVPRETWEDQGSKPVNVCVTAIRELNGQSRYFFSAKTHPFAGEETLDHVFDLFRGQSFLLFRCQNVPFNFMPLICFDYVYRDLHHSNIMAIIEKANEIYFRQHQNLDLLAVIQCNPKPEHRVFRDVVTGFYGEHLFKTPGTRDTLTLFINSSIETQLEGSSKSETFGHSSIVCGTKHKMPKIKLSEFQTDDFMGSPVSRLRFGDPTRLYICQLFPHHETDPRSSRTVIKVTSVYRPTTETGWEQMSGEELLTGISMDEDDSMAFY